MSNHKINKDLELYYLILQTPHNVWDTWASWEISNGKAHCTLSTYDTIPWSQYTENTLLPSVSVHMLCNSLWPVHVFVSTLSGCELVPLAM